MGGEAHLCGGHGDTFLSADTSAQWPTDDPRIPQILDIVAKETAIERGRLTPAASISALDIASLDMVQAIFAIESHFNVEIPVSVEQDGAEFITVGDLVRHVVTAIDAAGKAV